MFIGSNKDDDYIYSAEYSVNCAVRLKTATWLTKYLCMIQPNADITHILQSVIKFLHNEHPEKSMQVIFGRNLWNMRSFKRKYSQLNLKYAQKWICYSDKSLLKGISKSIPDEKICPKKINRNVLNTLWSFL